jgi:hypothetical protein
VIGIWDGWRVRMVWPEELDRIERDRKKICKLARECCRYSTKSTYLHGYNPSATLKEYEQPYVAALYSPRITPPS